MSLQQTQLQPQLAERGTPAQVFSTDEVFLKIRKTHQHRLSKLEHVHI